jgi:hypothetical protein
MSNLFFLMFFSAFELRKIYVTLNHVQLPRYKVGVE